MGKLNGKVAVVTGATAGIGVGVTTVMAEEGAKVVFCGRRMEKGKEIEAELKGKGLEVLFVQADMTNEADIANLFDTAVKTWGKVDILVSNAGVLKNFNLTTMDIEKDFDQVMALNLRAYVVATKYAVNTFQGGGNIINMASIGAFGGAPNMFSYAASKAAVVSFTKSMAKELADKQIRVNAICPGTIFSEMMPKDGEFTKATLTMIPMGRGGEPREIGTVAAFLASEEASYVDGTTIVVDGGMMA